MIHSVVGNGRPAAKIAGDPHVLISEELVQVEKILQNVQAPYRSRFGPLVKHLNHYRRERLRPAWHNRGHII